MFNQTSSPESKEAETLETQEPVEQQAERANAESGDAVPEPGAVTADSELQGKYQLLQEQFTRLAADFDNYRKRTREEQESLVKYGAQKSVTELLPVLDNLDRATASLTEASDPKLLYKSFSMMQKQLLDGLDSIGVKKIQAVGQPFDPQLHEAINRMESAEFPEDTIMYEAQSGYTLHEKVIRPAMVVVSTGGGDASVAASASDDTSAETADKPGNPFIK